MSEKEEDKGIDVGTDTIELPNELFSSINTPGVAKVDAIIFFL